jgi:cobalt/nickel transport system permease protein
MAIVLVVQAIVLGDGGLAALGANILNMALVPAGCVSICRGWQLDAGRWSPARAAVAAALSVPLAAVLITGQTALFRSGADLVGWQEFATRVIATHVWIGLLEGALTLSALAALAWLGQRDYRPATASLAAALAVAALALPWSSALPDGYESAVQAAGLSGWLAGGSAAALDLAAALGEQGAVLAGTLLVGLLVAALGLVASRLSPQPA